MSESTLIWDDNALKKLKKAPFFIRGYAKSKVEKAARAQGIKVITLDFMETIRKQETKN